jgi:hypothetical protein
MNSLKELQIRLLTGAALLALASMLALSGTANAAQLKKERFQVTFTAEHAQDWQVRPSDDEHTPNCIVGQGGTGTSTLEANTRKPQTVVLYTNREAGVAFGDVPIDAYLTRTFGLGAKPPDDCLTVEYEQLSTSATCDQTGIWGFYGHSPAAEVSLAAARGRIGVEVQRHDEERILEEIFPLCPFAGVEEGKVEGRAKLSKAKLFSGRPQTVKGYSRHDFPGPAEHNVEGYYEWQMTIKALKRR